MIVTLAGHVDHGKTTLVRLLTGKDTDRLAEEKRRGLTIDLGFAYLEEGGQKLGFVDVPGHRRFIHNMVAGVAALQDALLVIAADDGPMPQSREHLQILELIGVSRGVVALSKCDRVPRERLAEAHAEIGRLVAGSFLEGAPVVETAAPTGAGVEALKSLLLTRAGDIHAAEQRRPFRMAVDRVFTLKGTGLVATGTVHSGRVDLDQELHVFPLGATARARGLHVQNRPAASAQPGDRAAINLAGAGLEQLARGHWLCAHADSGHRTLVLDMKVLDDVPRAIRHWSPVHAYHATSHAIGRLALLRGSRLHPGERALVELVLDEPLLAKRGDRIVVRDQSLDRTLGGGSLIDNRAYGGRRRSTARLRGLDANAAATPGEALDSLLKLGPVDVTEFQGLWAMVPGQLQDLLASRAAAVHPGGLVSDAQWTAWCRALLDECEHRHARDASLQGLRENDFDAPVPEAFRTDALRDLVGAGKLERRGGRYQPRRHQAALSSAEQSLLKRLKPLLDQPQPPSLGDLGTRLCVPMAQLQRSIKTLASKGTVVQINDKRLYLSAQLAGLADVAEALSRRGPFTAREYRDATGIGRNVAIEVLEYFDAKGYTRRNGDARAVVGDRSRLLPSKQPIVF